MVIEIFVVTEIFVMIEIFVGIFIYVIYSHVSDVLCGVAD